MPPTTRYSQKRVLITGLTGFKGVWLGSWLKHLGATVSGLALEPEPAMERGWPGLLDRLPCHRADVRDLAALTQVFATEAPEMVFHLAAQPLVRRSYREPVETFATNVMGTVHVLEAARRSGSVQSVVVVTSDKCYENREWPWGYRECEAMGGHDPYSASKGCAELVTAAYRRSYAETSGLRIGSARAGNVIGGGDWSEDRLVPDLIRAVLSDQPLQLRNPGAIRPWQHVLEPLSGYLLLAERLSAEERFADGWNFGPSEARNWTVAEIARRLVEMHGSGEVIEANDAAAPHEAHYLRLDSARAAAELGWTPLLSVEERLRWTLDWYQSWNRRPESVWETTAQQIEAYEQRMAQCAPKAGSWSPASPASSVPPSQAA
jgi:CDP-glucose 4,6-dehydratase